MSGDTQFDAEMNLDGAMQRALDVGYTADEVAELVSDYLRSHLLEATPATEL